MEETEDLSNLAYRNFSTPSKKDQKDVQNSGPNQGEQQLDRPHKRKIVGNNRRKKGC